MTNTHFTLGKDLKNSGVKTIQRSPVSRKNSQYSEIADQTDLQGK